jgi:DNA-binding transcriptional regulator GbsR (MarR family)
MQEGAAEQRAEALGEVERGVIDFCCDGVKILGLPKSIGEIYGLLYVSPDPLALDDLVVKLGISKGSGSQGLKLLKTLGAIKDVEGPDQRRTYFEADLNLKQLVGGFVKEQVRPHLKSGDSKLKEVIQLLDNEEDEEKRLFYAERVDKLDRWSKQARLLLPLLQRVLG